MKCQICLKLTIKTLKGHQLNKEIMLAGIVVQGVAHLVSLTILLSLKFLYAVFMNLSGRNIYTWENVKINFLF